MLVYVVLCLEGFIEIKESYEWSLTDSWITFKTNSNAEVVC